MTGCGAGRTALGVLGYLVTVYLIFFLTYTPVTIDHVRGVQGRYFVIALPMAAIFLASLINAGVPLLDPSGRSPIRDATVLGMRTMLKF